MKHEANRNPGKNDILQAAKELAGYTLRITSNENNFPKRYRLSVVNKIQDQAVSIIDYLIMAQEIYPVSAKELDQRLLYQKQARATCRSMMTLMEIAANTFGINAGTFAYWTKMTRDVRNHTTAWIKSDIKRFEKLRGV